MKNNTIVILVLALIIGFGGGYMIRGDQGSEEVGNMHGAMGGMMMGLDGKTGDALDKAFLDGMIVHHQGALTMAQTLLKSTKRPELIKLGNDIITAQTGEIKMMQDWRTKWFAK